MLGIAEELMVKTSDIYLEQFARLGVFSKVESLAAAGAGQLPDDGNTPAGKNTRLSNRTVRLFHQSL